MSPLLSQWTFGSDQYAVEIALLGLVILMGNVSGGQMALIQGLRRIGDLARLQVIGAGAGTALSIGFYLWLGLRGIMPALLLTVGVQLAASWYFARRVPVPAVIMSWWESLRMAGGLMRLGLVLMWSGLAVSLVTYLTRALITQQISLEAVGIFSAAFALSGMFVNFVLNAMGADYYPRLAAVASDRGAVNRLVNEQTEIGLLLAVPDLLATLALTPWIIRIFYTEAFLPAADMLQWFVFGCLGRVISWPLGFVMLALGKGQWFFVTETLANALHLALIGVGLWVLGLEGVALAFFILYLALYGGGVWGRPPSDRLSLVACELAAVLGIAAHRRRDLRRRAPVATVAGDGVRSRGDCGSIGVVPARVGTAHRCGPSDRRGGLSGAGDTVGVWVVTEGVIDD